MRAPVKSTPATTPGSTPTGTPGSSPDKNSQRSRAIRVIDGFKHVLLADEYFKLARLLRLKCTGRLKLEDFHARVAQMFKAHPHGAHVLEELNWFMPSSMQFDTLSDKLNKLNKFDNGV